jgi:hypothetical protein
MKKILVLFGFFVACFLNAATPQNGTAGFNITTLLTDPAGGVPVWGGKSVHLNTVIRPGFQVIFEDLVPGANWGHPAVIKVLNPLGAIVEQVRTTRPPEGIEDAPQMWGTQMRPVGKVEFKINVFEGKLKVKDPSKFWAVLINGHADRRHWNDFSFLYRVLTQVYGYNKDHIFVADGSFKDRDCDLDGDGKCEILYGSKTAEIKAMMNEVKDKVQAGDHFVLAVNDHGGSTGGESTIVTMDGEMRMSEFKPLLAAIKADKVLTMYEQCFSGGFVRASTAYKRVSMAAAKDSEYSWASMDLNFDEWIYHAIAAFARQSYKGEVVSVDLTREGKVSAQQAFAHSVAKDQRQESPLLESYKNSGAAATIGLDF